MQLTRAEDYAIMFMAELARQKHDAFLSVGEVAEKYGISRLFLNKIAQKLCVAGFLESKEGKGGGYALKKNPKQIDLTTIVRALGSNMYINECLSGCGRSHTCQYKKVWDKINSLIIGQLSKMTLEEFVKISKEKHA